jgi:DHA1 family multidrug resistance protein-like MFS transporter
MWFPFTAFVANPNRYLDPVSAHDNPTGTLVRALAAATFLEWLGASAVLPILPLYLAHQGASDVVIGLAMGAFFAAGVVVQYPVGRLGDRVGATRVLLASLGLLGVASLGYLLPVGPVVEIGLRALQGAGAAAAEVAALSMVGSYVPEARRGGAYGAIFGAQLSGLAIAPLLGSIAGIGYIHLLFGCGTIAAAIACVPVLAVASAAARSAPQPDPDANVRAVRLRSIRGLQGCFIVALVAGLTAGIYEACWTLLLHRIGALSWQIGLSWSLFCAPFVAMSVPAGRLADRFDRRWLVVCSFTLSIVLLFIYPFLGSVVWVIALGASESVGIAIAYPAVQSLLSQLAPAHQNGRTQGVFSTMQTAAIAVAAAGGGALFSVASWLPFIVVGAVSTALLVCVPIVWAPVAGRITKSPAEPGVVASARQVG